MVRYLNTLPDVRTHASCQGTIGEGGPEPYRAQVMATWPKELEERIRSEFDVTSLGDGWGYLHPIQELETSRAEQPRFVSMTPKGIAIVEFCKNDAAGLGLSEIEAFCIAEVLAEKWDGTVSLVEIYQRDKAILEADLLM
jgi:hypothetical protein